MFKFSQRRGSLSYIMFDVAYFQYIGLIYPWIAWIAGAPYHGVA